MKNLTAVMGYTFREALQKKSFVISNLIMALLIIALFNIPNLIGLFAGTASAPAPETGEGGPGFIVGADVQAGTASPALIFMNRQDLVPADALAAYPDSAVVAGDGDIEGYRAQVSSGGLEALVVVYPAGEGLTFDYYWAGEDNSRSIALFLTDAQNTALLQRAGVDAGVAEAIVSGVSMENAEDLTGEGAHAFMGLSSILPMVASYILFFAIYFYGYRVSTSISSEKTSRVMETLITSTSPTAVVLGKTFANGLLGLLQLVFLIGVCAVSYQVFLPPEFQILGMLAGENAFSVPAVLVTLVYFILGYLVYAMLNAVTGATVSKAEDINSANMPITFLAMAAFLLSYFSSMAPGSTLNVAACLIPFTSPFTMPGRILAGAVPLWQIGASIVILIATAAVIAWFSIRIYSALILHYGNRLKLKDLLFAYQNQ